MEAKDPELNERIEAAFDDAYAEVERARRAFGLRRPHVDAQKKAVKQSIEALAEPLARVQGTLGVKS